MAAAPRGAEYHYCGGGAHGYGRYCCDGACYDSSRANAEASQNSTLTSRVMKWTRKVPQLKLAAAESTRLAQLSFAARCTFESDGLSVPRSPRCTLESEGLSIP